VTTVTSLGKYDIKFDILIDITVALIYLVVQMDNNKLKSNKIRELQNKIAELIPIEEFKIVFKSSPGRDAYPDFFAEVSYQNTEFRIVGEFIDQRSSPVFNNKLLQLNTYIAEKKGTVPLIVAPYLSPERQRQCREAGVFYLDFSGNVFIAYKGLYIERTGFPNRFPEKRKGRGPFSDKASLILRAILANNGDRVWGVRELAKKIGVDPGFVSRMVHELEKRHYIARINSKIKLRNPEGIFADWVYEYNYKKNDEARYFCLAEGPKEIMDKIRNIPIETNIEYALGIHAGAGLIAPYATFNEVHIYVPNKVSMEFFIKQLDLNEADDGANVIFLFPYYKHSAFYGTQTISGSKVVSDIQLYIDLYHYPLRGREQAEHLYEKRLKNHYHKKEP